MIIGIMGAMPDEVDQLCAKLENVTVEPYGGVEYHKPCGTPEALLPGELARSSRD